MSKQAMKEGFSIGTRYALSTLKQTIGRDVMLAMLHRHIYDMSEFAHRLTSNGDIAGVVHEVQDRWEAQGRPAGYVQQDQWFALKRVEQQAQEELRTQHATKAVCIEVHQKGLRQLDHSVAMQDQPKPSGHPKRSSPVPQNIPPRADRQQNREDFPLPTPYELWQVASTQYPGLTLEQKERFVFNVSQTLQQAREKYIHAQAVQHNTHGITATKARPPEPTMAGVHNAHRPPKPIPQAPTTTSKPRPIYTQPSDLIFDEFALVPTPDPDCVINLRRQLQVLEQCLDTRHIADLEDKAAFLRDGMEAQDTWPIHVRKMVFEIVRLEKGIAARGGEVGDREQARRYVYLRSQLGKELVQCFRWEEGVDKRAYAERVVMDQFPWLPYGVEDEVQGVDEWWTGLGLTQSPF